MTYSSPAKKKKSIFITDLDKLIEEYSRLIIDDGLEDADAIEVLSHKTKPELLKILKLKMLVKGE